MRNIYFPVILIISILLSSCASEEGEQVIDVEKRYTLEIPSFLSEVNNLHEEASLQYQNLFKEFYVIVIDEPKEEFHKVLRENELTDTYSSDIDGYTTIVLDAVVGSVENPTQTDMLETVVNGMPARLTSIKGVVDDIPVYYSYGVYEGQNTYYQVVIWTLSANQTKYQLKMEAILQSLRESNRQGKKGRKASTGLEDGV